MNYSSSSSLLLLLLLSFSIILSLPTLMCILTHLGFLRVFFCRLFAFFLIVIFLPRLDIPPVCTGGACGACGACAGACAGGVVATAPGAVEPVEPNSLIVLVTFLISSSFAGFSDLFTHFPRAILL